jgi:hypothetical protein
VITLGGGGGEHLLLALSSQVFAVEESPSLIESERGKSAVQNGDLLSAGALDRLGHVSPNVRASMRAATIRDDG